MPIVWLAFVVRDWYQSEVGALRELDGVCELRVDVGVGYRVYYAIADQQIIILLCGGDKRTQDSDIQTACSYWQDWQRRPNDER